jgi:hypothetical protein
MYGWSAFATITNRSGLNGTMHSYYKLTRVQFAGYTTFVCAASIFFLITYVFIVKTERQFIKSFWLFSLCVVFVIICEVYLGTRFSGKG